MKFDLALISPPLKSILARYFKSARLIISVVMVTTALAGIVSVSAPYLFSRLIDQVADRSDYPLLVWAFLGYAVLMGLSFALDRLISVFTMMTAQTLDFVSSTSFFARLVEKTSGFFLDHNPAEIESAQKRGAGALNVLVQFVLAAAIPGVTQLALSLVLLGAVISLDIAAIVVVYGVCYIALVAYSARKTRTYLDQAVEASQDGSRFVGNAIAGMDTLRQFGSDRWMIDQFSGRQKTALARWRDYAVVHGWYALLFGSALALQFAITLFLLVPRVNAGQLSVGDLVLFNTLLLQLNMPFQMIGYAIQQFAQSYSQFLPFARMWQAEAHADVDGTGTFLLSDGTVQFDTVGYLYPNGRGVEAASFTARRGTITYITGDTGSGKSTLFKLLLKSMPPQTGNITIDGIGLAEISRADWFTHAASVPQDIVLLNHTLATNIVLGRPHDEARLRRAAERAAILAFIDGLEEGFETVVGERGLKLSGGERQRIAIARALYADPAIVLLDEASSALDAETEREIMDQLRHIADQVTIIAITHRLSVIGPDDQVIRIGPDAEAEND